MQLIGVLIALKKKKKKKSFIYCHAKKYFA